MADPNDRRLAAVKQLPALLGEDAAGLSPTSIARLTASWDEEYQAFRHRDLSACDYVYIWVDGIHFNIRLEEDRLCTLVVIGVKADGTKEHWLHLRTSNVIESVFAPVRLRQRVTKGAGSRTKGLLMAYKLVAMAQRRWRRLNGAHLLPLVWAGVVFVDGVIQTETERKEAA